MSLVTLHLSEFPEQKVRETTETQWSGGTVMVSQLISGALHFRDPSGFVEIVPREQRLE